MVKYLLNMPENLKSFLTQIAKSEGYTLNTQILFILNEWADERKRKG